MSVFEKARELSNVIIETDEYKNLDKARVAFENNSITSEEFVKIKKTYDNYLEQIFSLIRMNVCDEETIETNESNSKCSSCSGCTGCSKK